MLLENLKEKAKIIVDSKPELILKKLLESFEAEIENDDWLLGKNPIVLANWPDYSDISTDIHCKYALDRKKNYEKSCGCQYCQLTIDYVEAKRKFKRLYQRTSYDMPSESVIQTALKNYKTAKYKTKIAKAVARFNAFLKIVSEYDLKKYTSFKGFLLYRYRPEILDMYGSTMEMYNMFFPSEYNYHKELGHII